MYYVYLQNDIYIYIYICMHIWMCLINHIIWLYMYVFTYLYLCVWVCLCLFYLFIGDCSRWNTNIKRFLISLYNQLKKYFLSASRNVICLHEILFSFWKGFKKSVSMKFRNFKIMSFFSVDCFIEFWRCVKVQLLLPIHNF